MVRADPDNDQGDPWEQVTRYNRDPSWDGEISAFALSILNDLPVQSGTSEDALRTMQLVFRIYYADSSWRKTYDIPDPAFTNNIDRFFTPEPARFAAAYLKYVQSILGGLDTAEIGRFIETLLASRERGATIFFIGNGGSAATASHFANDLAVGTNEYSKPFRAISLTDNLPLITAIGNDFGYEDIFVRQLRVLGKKGDLLIAISASGNSPNLLRAFDYARVAGIRRLQLPHSTAVMRTQADEGIHVRTGERIRAGGRRPYGARSSRGRLPDAIRPAPKVAMKLRFSGKQALSTPARPGELAGPLRGPDCRGRVGNRSASRPSGRG